MKKSAGIGIGHLTLDQRRVRRLEAFGGESFLALGVLTAVAAPHAVESRVQARGTARDGRAQRGVVGRVAYGPGRARNWPIQQRPVGCRS